MNWNHNKKITGIVHDQSYVCWEQIEAEWQTSVGLQNFADVQVTLSVGQHD